MEEGGSYRAGGAGGAIELVAHGAGSLKLNTGSRITVNGVILYTEMIVEAVPVVPKTCRWK